MPIPKIVISAAMMAAQMALTMSRKIEGPRLDDLKFTGGDYGAPLPMIWGMRRMQAPIFWAEDLREVKRQRKTKGGKFNEYTYYGTFAVALAGHEIEAVRRIWFDTHLAFDLSGEGPVTPFDFGTFRFDKPGGLSGDGAALSHPNVAIYLGTETQEPDGRMLATVEAEQGVGSCPAYRGTAYIVFKDVPLEKLGNRIPQVSVEVVGQASTAYPMETIGTGNYLGEIRVFYPDYSFILTTDTDGLAVVDVAARQVVRKVAVDPLIDDTIPTIAFMENGNMLVSDSGSSVVNSYDLSGNGFEYFDPSGFVAAGVHSLLDSEGVEHWMVPIGHPDGLYFDGTYRDPTGFFGTFHERMMFATTNGQVWVVGEDQTGATDTVIFWKLHGPTDGPEYHVVTGLPSTDSEPLAFHYSDATNDHFVLYWGGSVYRVDRLDGTLSAGYAVDYPSGAILHAWRAIAPGAATFWIGFEEISSVDLTRVRLLDWRSWKPSEISDQTPVIYDPINHALIGGTGTMAFYYLDRVASDGVALSVIAGEVADMCNVEDYDFSALDQIIPGWSATKGQASNILEPLFDAYDSDIRPHDFTLQGVKRAGVSGGTLLTERFAKNDPRYTVKIRAAAELPAAVLINFADMDADQQPATVRSSRPLDATDARGEMSLDMTTLALETDDARALADRRFRRVWNERKEITLALTAQQLALEPADVRTLDLDGEEITARLVNLTVRANGILDTEWKYDHASLATLDTAAGATFDGRNPSVIAVPLISKGFVLDIPYLDDVDDQSPPIAYVLAAPFVEGAWSGATIYQQVGSEYTDDFASVPSSDQATWGYVTEELPYVNPNLWDRSSSVTVTLQTGSLTGCTEADIDADPSLNRAAIGIDGRWEVVNFTTATLTATRTYTVSGFKRGRRGTEWAAELHAAGDTFVLLDQAQDVALGLSEVATNLSFKAITAGRTTGFPFDLEPYTGASLKPYAPCQLEAVKESNGDWTLTWVRRTRVGGDWTGGGTIPLSETTEAYEVDIMNGAAVVRTISVSSATATWTDAQQVTDFGSTQSSLTYRVYQISAAVDRGFEAEATA